MAKEQESKEIESAATNNLITYDFKTDKFKVDSSYLQNNTVTINGRPTVTTEYLTALGHAKGIWKMQTEILQFPTSENGNVCICKTVLGGYDMDPAEGKIVRVEYEDIADASPMNCTKMVAKAFIRMASTRSQARALRKYTNFDLTCADEMDGDVTYTSNGPNNSNQITVDKLNAIKQVVNSKGIQGDQFNEIMMGLFNHTNYTAITEKDGDKLINVLNDYVVPTK